MRLEFRRLRVVRLTLWVLVHRVQAERIGRAHNLASCVLTSHGGEPMKKRPARPPKTGKLTISVNSEHDVVIDLGGPLLGLLVPPDGARELGHHLLRAAEQAERGEVGGVG